MDHYQLNKEIFLNKESSSAPGTYVKARGEGDCAVKAPLYFVAENFVNVSVFSKASILIVSQIAN